MENHSEDKAKRILEMYNMLMQGKIVSKVEMSASYGVSPRTIQRDIADIQCFLQEQRTETGSIQEVVFDKQEGGYLLWTEQNRCHNQSPCLSEKEILAVCRILLGSRALMKAELFPIIQSLIAVCSAEGKVSVVMNLLQNGMREYMEPEHNRKLIDLLWNLEQAVKGRRHIEIRYHAMEEERQAAWKLRPMQITFLESKFYLVACVLEVSPEGEVKRNDGRRIKKVLGEPVVYQIDRIEECLVMEENLVF